MTVHSKVVTVGKAAVSKKRGRATKRGKIPLAASDVYEDGKRVAGLPTVFERSTEGERKAINHLRQLKLDDSSEAEALKTLRALQRMIHKN